MDKIVKHEIPLNSKNILTIFVNREINLLVVDIIDKKARDGNEIVRMQLDENDLLGHIEDFETVDIPEPGYTSKRMQAFHVKGGLKFAHREEEHDKEETN